MTRRATTVEVERIRAKIRRGEFAVYAHAAVEAMKDGLTGDDILHVALNGKLIEDHPERNRCLLYATVPNGTPVHIVVDYAWEEEYQIVTVYIPDSAEWINYQVRKRG
jgi:hypothetical protein